MAARPICYGFQAQVLPSSLLHTSSCDSFFGSIMSPLEGAWKVQCVGHMALLAEVFSM